MRIKVASSARSLARWLLIGAIGLIPLYYLRFRLLGIPTNGVELMIGLAFLLILASGRVRLPLLIPISLLLAGLVLGTAFADDRESALGIVKSWFVIPILFFWAGAAVLEQRDLGFATRILFYQTLLVSSYALLQWLGVIPLLAHQTSELTQYLTQERALAFYESPNYLAMYLVPLLILVWPAVQGWQKLLLILPFSAVILSGSQGGQLSLAIFGGLLLWLQAVPAQQHRALKLTFTALAALTVGLVVFALFYSGTENVRFLLWHEGIRLFLAHPFTGIGPGQFALHLGADLTQLPQFANQIQPYALHPHSLLLTTLASGGLLAAVGLIGVLKATLQRLWVQAKPVAPLVLSATLALGATLFHGLVDTTYFKNDLAVVFWLLILIIFQACRADTPTRAV